MRNRVRLCVEADSDSISKGNAVFHIEKEFLHRVLPLIQGQPSTRRLSRTASRVFALSLNDNYRAFRRNRSPCSNRSRIDQFCWLPGLRRYPASAGNTHHLTQYRAPRFRSTMKGYYTGPLLPGWRNLRPRASRRRHGETRWNNVHANWFQFTSSLMLRTETVAKAFLRPKRSKS